jgi:hypothetical protein
VGFGGWQERLPEEMELPDDSVVTLAPPAATVVLTPAEVESTRAAAERELERWRQPAEDDVHAALTDGDLARGQVLTDLGSFCEIAFDSYLFRFENDAGSPTNTSRKHLFQLMWQRYEALTAQLSIDLAEQLRLVLEPTMASKLQVGPFTPPFECNSLLPRCVEGSVCWVETGCSFGAVICCMRIGRIAVWRKVLIWVWLTTHRATSARASGST